MLFLSLHRPSRSSPRPPASTKTTKPAADCRPRRRLPTSPPPTYLLVYFVDAVCYQVSTFATVLSSFSLTRSFRFRYLYVVAGI